MNCRKQEQQPY